MRDIGRSLGKCMQKSIIILVTGIILGTLLITLAYMLPVNEENRNISYEILEKEAWYPRTSVIFSDSVNYFLSFYPDVLDNASDKIMLTTSMDSSAGTPLVRAMESYGEYAGNYEYYWHGYVTILRPLFLLFDFSELRMLNGVCQILIAVLLARLIGREKGMRHVLAFITSYILLNPWAAAMGLQYSWVFYIAFGGTVALLSRRNFFAQKQRYLYFFIVLGMFTSYFDLLTYPLFTWGFPLVWWIVTEKQEQKEAAWVKSVVLSGIAWIVGYACMWVAKWGIATIVLKRDIFEAAMDEVFMRSGTAETGMDNLAARWNAVYMNWKHYAYKIYMIILVGWLVWWICCSLMRKWSKSSKGYAFLLLGVSSVVWYFVLSNHTSGHHFFTYRIYGVSISAFLALILESVENFRESVKLSGRERAAVAGVVGVSAVLACFCTLLAKEDYSVTNGSESFRRVKMEQVLEMEFVPSCNIIGNIDMGLECDSRKGQYKVKVWEGDKLKYQHTFLLENSSGKNYQGLTTWWVLKHGETYRITVEAVETGAPVYAWLTESGNMPLVELGEVSIDGSAAGGQLLMGLRYLDRHYVPKNIQFFIVLSWLGIFMAVCYTLSNTKIRRPVVEDRNTYGDMV